MCFSNLFKNLILISIVIGLTACTGATDEAVLTNSDGSSDKTSPSKPSNLRKLTNGTNSNSIAIEWDPSTDDTGVIGYIILRDGAPLTKTLSTNYIDENVSPETTYEYTVVAYDAANNTASSKRLTISNSLTKVSVTLNWTPPTLNTDSSALTNLNGYKIYYGRSKNNLTNTVDITNTGITEFVIENLSPNTLYYFSITAINSNKVESTQSNIVSINITG